MPLMDLPSEILQVFIQFLTTPDQVIALSLTCKRLRAVLLGSPRSHHYHQLYIKAPFTAISQLSSSVIIRHPSEWDFLSQFPEWKVRIRRLALGYMDSSGMSSLWLCSFLAHVQMVRLYNLDTVEEKEGKTPDLSSVPDLSARMTSCSTMSCQENKQQLNMPKLSFLKLTASYMCHLDWLVPLFGLSIPLKTLVLKSCIHLTQITALAQLTSLQNLELHDCRLLSDISVLGNLSHLQTLRLDRTYVINFDFLALLSSLRVLSITSARYLKRLECLAGLLVLSSVSIVSCCSLDSLRGLRNLPQLTQLKVQWCGNITTLDGLQNLPRLGTLVMSHSAQLADLNAVANLPSLHTLDVSFCENISSIEAVGHVRALRHIDLRCSHRVTSVKSLTRLHVLETLNILDGYLIQKDVNLLAEIASLRRVHLSGVKSSDDLIWMSMLPVLQSVYLNRSSIVNFDWSQNAAHRAHRHHDDPVPTSLVLRAVSSLRKLQLEQCSRLLNLNGLARFPELVSLDLIECDELQNVSDLFHLVRLQSLHLASTSLTDISSFHHLRSLQELSLSLPQLTHLDDLSQAYSLRSLALHDCPRLDSISGVQDLPSLRRIVLRHCRALKNVDCLVRLPRLDYLDILLCGDLWMHVHPDLCEKLKYYPRY